MVRTVSGLKPVDVLWRRMDAAYMDPLELKPEFVDRHARHCRAHCVSNRSRWSTRSAPEYSKPVLLLAFMPAISKALHRRDLALPSIATWWCGQETEREHVVGPDRADDDRSGAVDAAALRGRGRDSAWLVARCRCEGRPSRPAGEGRARSWSARKKSSFRPRQSMSMASWNRGHSCCAFLRHAHKDGWSFMPGGFARVGRRWTRRRLPCSAGGQAADVWITSSGPVPERIHCCHARMTHSGVTCRARCRAALLTNSDVDGTLHRAR